MKIQFASNSYQSRSLPISAQRLVNLFPEAQPSDAKSPVALFGTPGLVLWTTCSPGPIRGMHVMGSYLYVVSSNTVYRVDNAGSATNIGSVSGSGPVTMADNGTQCVAVTTLGSYVITQTAVTQITDVDFHQASSVTVLDSYHIFSRADTGQFFISSLLDATAYDALDFATAESNPDNLVRAFADHQELWLFGENTTEVWVNTGAADFPFERRPGAILEYGTAAKFSIAKFDNSIAWLGDDLIVYKANGYQAERISHHGIEAAIAGYTTVDDATAFSYTDQGHNFYVLNFPTEGATWVFDAATGLWHERESRPSGVSIGRWRADNGAYFAGKNLVGDYVTGQIWQLDMETYTEGSDAIVRSAAAPVLWNDTNRAFMSSFQLDIESGVGLSTGQGSDPIISLDWSDDGGFTWSNEHFAAMGQIGQYRQRVKWYRLGTFRQRVVRVSVSDPVKCVVIGAYAEIKPGAR